MPNQETRLAVFQELLANCHNLYMWTYDPDMHLLNSSCPETVLSSGFIVPTNDWEDTLAQVQHQQKPVIMSSNLELMWIASGSFDKTVLQQIHVLGPFYMYDIPPTRTEAELRRLNLSAPLMEPAITFLKKLPVLNITRVLEYGVMLHFCITGERLSLEDIRFTADKLLNIPMEEVGNIHGTYAAEREMLRLVREGDLNFKKHMQTMTNMGRVGNISDGHPMRQLKNMMIVNITLFSRAAMEGGLPPETAYTLSDRYFQAIEKSRSMQALIDIGSAMQEDFVQRVHQVRQNESYSKPIRSCVEQLRSRMEEDISLELLAGELGYSPYYLSRKFRNETGQTFKEYLRQVRLERAKFLLRNTDESVLDIADRLRFCSQSYFSDTFRKAYGISPTDYREQLDG